MTVRWTEKQLQEYYQHTGKGKKPKKAALPKPTKSPTVEQIPSGILVTLWRIHPSLNRWTKLNPFKQAEIKKEWEQEIFYLLAAYRHYKLTGARVEITYYLPGVVPDKDNYAPKFLMDGLVKSGLLADDSQDIVSLDWRFESAQRGDKRTEVRILWEG